MFEFRKLVKLIVYVCACACACACACLRLCMRLRLRLFPCLCVLSRYCGGRCGPEEVCLCVSLSVFVSCSFSVAVLLLSLCARAHSYEVAADPQRDTQPEQIKGNSAQVIDPASIIL